MNEVVRAAVEPILNAYREHLADMRANGSTEDEIAENVKAAVDHLGEIVEDPETRTWLIAEFKAAAEVPRVIHEGPETVQ